MISETAGAMERSKAAIICWGSLQVWLKIMQLLSYNSLSCKPINIPISPLAAMHFFCFPFLFFRTAANTYFPWQGQRMSSHVQFLVLIVANTRACRENSLASCATALFEIRGLGVRPLRSGRSPESTATIESMNTENNHFVLRNFYLSFGSVM